MWSTSRIMVRLPWEAPIFRYFVFGILFLFALPIFSAASSAPATATTQSSTNISSQLSIWLAAPPASRGALADQSFASLPLSADEAKATRELLWKNHLVMLRQDRKKEWAESSVAIGSHAMRFKIRNEGSEPPAGWPLFISLHGGGSAPPAINDQQWSNQIKLYRYNDAKIIAPRAPTDTWNLWHEPHIDPLIDRVIQDAVAFEDVNPNRVFLQGYSAGGDGVYQLAPRMADRFAGAAMMAGHPNNARADPVQS